MSRGDRAVKLENYEFSPWIKWGDLGNHRSLLSKPGVYLLAHFDSEPPPGPAQPSSAPIAVLSESERPLRERIKEFERSATTGKRGHSIGRTYHKIFEWNPNMLFVSILNFDDGKKTHESIRSDIVGQIVEYHWDRPTFIRKKR